MCIGEAFAGDQPSEEQRPETTPVGTGPESGGALVDTIVAAESDSVALDIVTNAFFNLAIRNGKDEEFTEMSADVSYALAKRHGRETELLDRAAQELAKSLGSALEEALGGPLGGPAL